MSYRIKEIFYTIQGEGANTGRAAVFCRFSGCNLWSGREADRESAVCRFCDTDFVGTDGSGGGSYESAETLAKAIAVLLPPIDPLLVQPLVVCTGGEPMLQMDEQLTSELHRYGFQIAIETNGTLPIHTDIDWICVSPKAGTTLVQERGNELKIVYPQPGINPELFEGLSFDHFYIQPMDGPQRDENTRRAVQYCLDHPKWKLSLQSHKFIGIR